MKITSISPHTQVSKCLTAWGFCLSILLFSQWSYSSAKDLSGHSNHSENDFTKKPKIADENHPCQKIILACKAAGYEFKSANPEKALFKKCVTPLTEGSMVAEINVSEEDLNACKKHRSHWKFRPGHRGKGADSNSSTFKHPRNE